MKLTESTNTYRFSDIFGRTINVNKKKIVNCGFLQIPIS